MTPPFLKQISDSAVFQNMGAICLMLLMSLTLNGCGGGGAAPLAGSTTTSPNGTINIAAMDAAGATSSAVTSSTALIVKATLTDASAKPAKGVLVTFSLSSTIATLSPVSGTALTDENGVAQISIVSAGTSAGAAEITASATVVTTPVTAKLAFNVATPVAPGPSNGTISLEATDPGGAASNTVTTSTGLLVKATVTDTSNKRVKGVIVTFTLSSSIATLSPVTGTALTDDNGVAQINIVSAGTSAGAAEISASATAVTTPVTAKLAFNVATPVLPGLSNGGIRLAATDMSGASSNSTSTSNPLLVKATVVDASARAVKGVVVSFTLSASIATLSPVTGTALTDDNGVAQISVVSAGTSAGAAEITATATVFTTPVTAKLGFNVATPVAPVVSKGAIRVELLDAFGVPKNLVTSASPLTVKATVTDDAGVLLKDKIVTFSTSASIVSFSPVSGTALTNASGVAQISLQSGGQGGAGEITASVAVGSTPVTAKAAFSVGAAPSATPVAINFVTAAPADASIVIKGSGGNGRTEIALLTFKVVDSSNSGIANVGVAFSTSQNVTLASSSGITDQNGQVTVALSAGTTPTTVRVQAAVAGTSISVLSDQVTVTTGLPVQGSLTLAFSKRYVEGLDVANSQFTASVLVADANGGAVADGTAAIFTTDTGAIVGTGGARCLTVQGACSVVWRSQNPRVSNGLGTIIATVSAGAPTPLSTQNRFYVSGSYGTVYKVNDAARFGTSTRLSTGGVIPLDFTSSCLSQSFYIEVVDVNGNPMPEGTVISAVNTKNAVVTVSPGEVTYQGLAVGSSNRGTIHNVSVRAPACLLGSSTLALSFFDVSVKSPAGGTTMTRVSLGTYPYSSSSPPE